MLKAFWANTEVATAKGLTDNQRLMLINRAVRPMLDYRCSRWPPQIQIAKEIDAYQRRLVASAARLPRRPGESLDVFCRRRASFAAAVCRKGGTWSKRWFQRALDWDDHLRRRRNGNSWAAKLLDYRGAPWLASRRLEQHSSLSSAGRTGTRLHSGCVFQRWHDGVTLARLG